MNKLLKTLSIFSLSFLLPLSLFSQSGDGSSGNPFYGTISSSTTWDWEGIGAGDGKIYIGTASNNDITIGSGGHLTILPGATLIFTQTASDLIITGTGRITADGAPGVSSITFTKATGNSYWGHIIFDGMSGTNASLFDNCIIEYGRKTGTTLIFDNVGGGICANYSYLTIQNCTFKDNYALFGGALFIGYGQSPVIESNKFITNESREAGGAIYIYDNSAVQINNCIIESNHANGVTASYYRGGGVQFGVTTPNAKVVNSTFVNNTATRGSNGVYFYSSGSVVNCVFWGSNDEVGFRSSAGTSSYCGIQGFVDSPNFGNCFDLNSTNSASDGPNFNAIDGSDWSIKFISPVRDAGTNSGAPATDYAGDPRIGLRDIGAYEVQYSRWDGSSGTSWGTADNWEQNMNPTSGASNVVIPTGLSTYPTSTGTSYTIGSGTHLVLESGSQTTFSTLTNSSGTLQHLSDASGIASLIFDSYTDSGTEEFEMFITGGSSPDHKWHYIAVPANMSKTTFTNISPYNLLEFDEAEIDTTIKPINKMVGWQWHDGYDGTNGFSTLVAKKGYNFYHTQDVTVSIPTVTGLLSSLGASVTLQYNMDGLNLIGNSLTSSINWDNVSTSGDMRDAVYFTKDNALVSYVDGTGTPSGTTGIIPPFQGFMVKALEAGCTIDFTPAGVKSHGTVNRYKGESLVPLVRLTMNSEGSILDETVVRLKDYSTTEFDNKFDASKLFSTSTDKAQILTQISAEKYSINTIPFPEVFYSVPLVIKVMNEGDYTINNIELTGLDYYNVILRDVQEDMEIDLSAIASYAFSSPVGTIDNRFVLEFSPLGVGTEDIYNDESFKAYSYSSILNIIAGKDFTGSEKSSLTVYDITGRVVLRELNLRLTNGETKQFGFNEPDGIYIIELISDIKRSTRKIIHR